MLNNNAKCWMERQNYKKAKELREKDIMQGRKTKQRERQKDRGRQNDMQIGKITRRKVK